MIEEKIIQDLKQNIAKNNINIVITRLLEITSKEKTELHKEILLISAKYDNYKSDSRKGIKEQSLLNVEIAAIVNTLIEIVDNLNSDKLPFFTTKHHIFLFLGRMRLLLFSIAFLIALLFGIFYLYFRWDILTETFKGTQNVDYSQLLIVVILFSISFIIFHFQIRKK